MLHQSALTLRPVWADKIWQGVKTVEIRAYSTTATNIWVPIIESGTVTITGAVKSLANGPMAMVPRVSDVGCQG